MFVRCKRRFKDGKEHRYWSVVENVRVSGGRVVQRQVLYLGEINDSQRAAWCRSIEVLEGASRSRQVALFPEDREAPELDCEVVQVRLAELTLHDPRQWGACWLALTLWERLELDRFWGPRLPASRQGTRWLDLLKIQVCYRLIDPGSDWRLHRHWYEHSALRDLLGCDRVIASNTLYRCLDKLAAHKQDFFSFLRARWTTMFNARFDILLYDLTSTFFESDPPFEDKRPVRPQPRPAPRLRAGGDRLGGDPGRLSVGVRGDAGQHRRQHDAGGLSHPDRGPVRAFGPSVDHGPRDSDRAHAGGDARGRCTGALSGGNAQGPADPAREVLPRAALAGSASIGRCQAPDSRRGAVRARAQRTTGAQGAQHAPTEAEEAMEASGRAWPTIEPSRPAHAQARRGEGKTLAELGSSWRSRSRKPTKSWPPTG